MRESADVSRKFYSSTRALKQSRTSELRDKHVKDRVAAQERAFLRDQSECKKNTSAVHRQSRDGCEKFYQRICQNGGPVDATTTFTLYSSCNNQRVSQFPDVRVLLWTGDPPKKKRRQIQ